MRSVKLAKLESLAKKQAEQTLELLERQRMELSLMDKHHHELKTLNRDYQEGVVGQTAVAPSLLAHRRAFVAQLSRKLDVLASEREKRNHALQSRVDEHLRQKTQTAAIGAMAQHELATEKEKATRLEQRQVDDSLNALRSYKSTKEDNQNA